MDKEKYYMNLPKDLSGSVAKNRFRLELLWGISKMDRMNIERTMNIR